MTGLINASNNYLIILLTFCFVYIQIFRAFIPILDCFKNNYSLLNIQSRCLFQSNISEKISKYFLIVTNNLIKEESLLKSNKKAELNQPGYILDLIVSL